MSAFNGADHGYGAQCPSTARGTGAGNHGLARPAGFEFRPGQALEVQLPDATDAPGDDGIHAFSIVSAPHEPELVFATRMRDSAYKRALATLPLGAELGVDGPFGSLTLHRKAERAGLLIAGGIGITPFMSMIRHAAYIRSGPPLVLLYSNRRPEDTAFLAELQAYAQALPGFELHATMTDMEHSTQLWLGDTGKIDAVYIRNKIERLSAPVVYVTGPPGMVEALREAVVEAGVDEDDVRTEAFYGY